MSQRAFTAFARLRDPGAGRLDRPATSGSPTAWSTGSRRRPPTSDRAELSRRFGVDDQWPVLCEPFTQWVLEDDFADGRPPLRRRRRADRVRRGALRADEAAAAQRQPSGPVLSGLPRGVPARPRGHDRPAVRAVPAGLHDAGGHPDAAAGSRHRSAAVRAPAHRAVLQSRGPRHRGPAVRRRIRPHSQVPAPRHPAAARRRRPVHPLGGRRGQLGPLRRGHRRERRAARDRRRPRAATSGRRAPAARPPDRLPRGQPRGLR